VLCFLFLWICNAWESVNSSVLKPTGVWSVSFWTFCCVKKLLRSSFGLFGPCGSSLHLSNLHVLLSLGSPLLLLVQVPCLVYPINFSFKNQFPTIPLSVPTSFPKQNLVLMLLNFQWQFCSISSNSCILPCLNIRKPPWCTSPHQELSNKYQECKWGTLWFGRSQHHNLTNIINK